MSRLLPAFAPWALLFVLVATVIQGCAMSPPDDTLLDHPAVARYVSGWQAHDGARVASALAATGQYRDPSLPAALGVSGLPAHVAAYKEARFELQGIRRVAPDRLELRWKAVWPQRQRSFDYVDTLTLDGTAIARVDSTGTPPPDAAGLVAAYEVLHDTPTPERLQALLTADVEVYGSTLPPAGLRFDTYPKFLETLRGTTFRQQPDTPLELTKDGRIAFRWTLTAGGKRLAAGTDYLTVEQGRIRKIVGVY